MISDKKNPESTEQISLYTKLARGGMTAENINDLFEHEMSKLHNKYDLLDIKIDDTNKFRDTYNFEMPIEYTRINNIKYEPHDVFMVVKLHQDPNGLEIVNLYTDYQPLTE